MKDRRRRRRKIHIVSVMQGETINKYLLIFTFTVALIALVILLFIFLKDKFCSRKNLYAKHSYLQTVSQQNELSEILHDTPNKILLRSSFHLLIITSHFTLSFITLSKFNLNIFLNIYTRRR